MENLVLTKKRWGGDGNGGGGDGDGGAAGALEAPQIAASWQEEKAVTPNA